MTKIRFVLICLLLCLFIPSKLAVSSVGKVLASNVPIVEQQLLPQEKVKILRQDNGDKQIKKRNEMIEKLKNNDLIISPIKSLNNEQQDSALCLAMNVYNEARSSSVEDMIAVSLTVLSRHKSGKYVNGKENNICNVVFAEKQYSWTNVETINLPKEKGAWVKSQTIALLLITDTNVLNRIRDVKFKHYVLTSLFESTTDKWFNQAKSTKIIGAHTYLIFEEDNSNKQSQIAMDVIGYIKGRLSKQG